MAAIAQKERITTRVSHDCRVKIEYAAELSGSTMSQFVAEALLKEAAAVIEREQVLRLATEDASVFFEALENPPKPNARLRAAIAAHREQAQVGTD